MNTRVKIFLLAISILPMQTAVSEQEIIYGHQLQSRLQEREAVRKKEVSRIARKKRKIEEYRNDCIDRLKNLIERSEKEVDNQALIAIMKDCMISDTNSYGFKKISDFFHAVALSSDDKKTQGICTIKALELVQQERADSLAKFDRKIFELSLQLLALQQAEQESESKK